MKRVTALFFVLCYAVCIALASGHSSGADTRSNLPAFKQKMVEVALPSEQNVAAALKAQVLSPAAVPSSRVLAGTYTGLTGFFDFQVNVGACQYIRVDPSDATGRLIHVIMMEATDSTNPTGPSRGTYYAYSTDAGATWDTFNQLRIPERRSGYPSLDMLQGATQGTIISNHNDPGSGNIVTFTYVDSPPGVGAFAEIGTPGQVFGSDERIWPDVTGASDGSIVLSASRQTARTCFITRTSDFVSWAPWTNLTPTGGAGLPMKSNGTGRVGCLHNTTFGTVDGVYLFESTDNGATWPATGQQIFPNPRVEGPDSFAFTLGSDLVYNGNNVYVVSAEINANASVLTDSAQITFWSQATGYVVAASKRNTPGVAPVENLPTLNTVTLDMPSIGLSGNAIVVAYHAMMKDDLSPNGYNCCDIFLVHSTDGGATWSNPRNLSNSRGLDDRFVSVAPWNPPGVVDLVWQEDTEAGGQVIGDPGTTIQRTRQVFLRTGLTTDVPEVGTRASSFSLNQNYPNPFNPNTVITYSLPSSSNVKLSVYGMMGQEVATLVNEHKEAGEYRVSFGASKLSSGVYFYTLKAGSYSVTRKMVLMK